MKSPATRSVEDLGVVGPGRCAQPDGRTGVDGGDEVTGHTQGTGAAGCVHRFHAPAGHSRVVGAEDEVAHGSVVGGIAADGLVDLGGLIGEDARLGFTDGIEHRRDPGLIDIDTRCERHLVGSVVSAEALHQPQDGVGRTGLEISEHGHAQMVARLSSLV